MVHKMSFRIHTNGKVYTVTGNYYSPQPASFWQPEEPGEFDITSMVDMNGVELQEFGETPEEYDKLMDIVDDIWREIEYDYWKGAAEDMKAILEEDL